MDSMTRPRCNAWARSQGRQCIRLATMGLVEIEPGLSRWQPINGRCRNHGGLSTGPATPEGKARAMANLVWMRVPDVRARYEARLAAKQAGDRDAAHDLRPGEAAELAEALQVGPVKGVERADDAAQHSVAGDNGSQ